MGTSHLLIRRDPLMTGDIYRVSAAATPFLRSCIHKGQPRRGATSLSLSLSLSLSRAAYVFLFSRSYVDETPVQLADR